MSERIIFDEAIEAIAAGAKLSESDKKTLRVQLLEAVPNHHLRVYEKGAQAPYDFNIVRAVAGLLSARFGKNDWDAVKTFEAEVYTIDLNEWLDKNWLKLKFRFGIITDTLSDSRPSERELGSNLLHAPSREPDLVKGAHEGMLGADLLKRVLHHIEGEEVTQYEGYFANEDKPRNVTFKTWGPDRWIRKVHERHVLTALDSIALIHLVLVNFSDFPSRKQEQALVEGWAFELIKSAQAEEVIARDPFTLLPFGGDLASLEWGLSMKDADSFIAKRGMGWTFSKVAQDVYDESFGTPANQLLKAADIQASANESNQAGKELDPDEPWITFCKSQINDIFQSRIASGKDATKDFIAEELVGRCNRKKYITKRNKPVSKDNVLKRVLMGWTAPEIE